MRKSLPEPEQADELIFPFELVLAEVVKIRFYRVGKQRMKISRSGEPLSELLHEAFHAEDRVDGIADDRGIALGDEPDVAAGHGAMMKRHRDLAITDWTFRSAWAPSAIWKFLSGWSGQRWACAFSSRLVPVRKAL